ncbi:MAG: Thioredoxin [Firmicutes bacterium ADurb.Bin419]|jgi:thiol:disulfide interchange protein DsbD|uniref:thioredoxin family protein n=1 Tax=Methanobacterium sp. MZD130B TaxID=3394378 RepID=UPI0009C4264D|nr:MAG: Thioredoxin [Firmicutes bacterium ADurb.Bin419]
MNKHSISLVLIFIGLLIVAVIVSSLNSDETNKDPKSSIKWDNDYNHAIQVAKNTHKKIFIYFYADWCVYCTQMDDLTYASSEVKEKLMKNYVLLKLDVDANPQLSQKYQAYSLPTIIILDYNGREIKRIIGYQSPEQLLTQL